MLKAPGFLFHFLIFALISSCSSSRIIVAWKTEKLSYENYNKIMVAGITSNGNDSFRLKTEQYFTAELRNLGYNAISAFEEFGPVGLANLTQEETYIKLCNRGVDAVIIIALIDRSKEKNILPRKSYGYPNDYYFKRIWNYKNIQPGPQDDSTKNKAGYFWESILFNLRTLEAECTIQTKAFHHAEEEKMAHEFEKNIIKKMRKEGILKKQETNKLKPF